MAKKGGKAKIKARKAEKKAKEKAAVAKKKAKLAAEKAAREAKKAKRVVQEPSKRIEDELESVLQNADLDDDQKEYIRTLTKAKVDNDVDTIRRLEEATQAGMKYSDPYFKAQARIALDALQRELTGADEDLEFKEKQLRSTLEALRADTAASREYLSLEQAQDLKELERRYETNLENTQEQLAASGFTVSSRRARAEQLLAEENQGLVESANRQFGYKVGNLDRALGAEETSTSAQIENLRRLAAESKLDLFRQTEQKVGSGGLPSVSGLQPLGGIAGDISYEQEKDARSFASNYVF